jgi:hypothetical protein
MQRSNAHLSRGNNEIKSKGRKASSVTNERTLFRQTGTGIAAGSDVERDIRIGTIGLEA